MHICIQLYILRGISLIVVKVFIMYVLSHMWQMFLRYMQYVYMCSI